MHLTRGIKYNIILICKLMFRSLAFENHIIESIAFCRPEFQSVLNPGDPFRHHDIWYSAPRLYIQRLSVDLFWALWTAPTPAGSGIQRHSGMDRNSTGSHEVRPEFFQSHLYLSEIDQHMKRILVVSEKKATNDYHLTKWIIFWRWIYFECWQWIDIFFEIIWHIIR